MRVRWAFIIATLITAVAWFSLAVRSDPAPAATAAPLFVVSVDGVGSDGHYAAGALDGDPSTRWEACGNGATLTFDLGRTETVQRVRINFYRGNERSYRFTVRVASDSGRSKWSVAFRGQSALKAGFQSFTLPRSQAARFVQIVGHGNSSSSDSCANSYVEVQLLGRPYFSGNFETGNASQYTDLECHDPSDQFRIVSKPVRQGRYAARFEESPGDVWSGDGTIRCLAANANTDERNGDNLYYSMSFYFPAPISNNLLWETHTRKDNINVLSNPVSVVPHAIMAYGSPATYDQTADRLSYRLETGAQKWSGTGWAGWTCDKPDLVIMKPIPVRTWIDIIVHIRFTNTDNGQVQVWARTAGHLWPSLPQIDVTGVPTLQWVPGGADPYVPTTIQTTTLYDEIGLYKGGMRTDSRDVAFVDAYRITGSLGDARAVFHR